MNPVIKESNITEDLASPVICKALMDKGLTKKTVVQWILGHDFCMPMCYAYDIDKYYAPSHRYYKKEALIEIIPAYRLIDLIKLLPNYTLEKQDGDYHLMLPSDFNIEVKDARIADAFAKAIDMVISKRIIPVVWMNSELEKLLA